MRCTAVAVSLRRRCARQAKYVFVGVDREEPMCGDHAYQWLGGRTRPAWVRDVRIIRKEDR